MNAIYEIRQHLILIIVLLDAFTERLFASSKTETAL